MSMITPKEKEKSEPKLTLLWIWIFSDAVALLDRADVSAGMAHRQRMRRHIPGDQAFGTDHGTGSDGDPGQDRHISADPHVIADRHRQRLFQSLIALIAAQGMPGGVDAAVGTDETAGTDGDASTVHEIGIMIEEGPFPI